jgi:hypothetical protein
MSRPSLAVLMAALTLLEGLRRESVGGFVTSHRRVDRFIRTTCWARHLGGENLAARLSAPTRPLVMTDREEAGLNLLLKEGKKAEFLARCERLRGEMVRMGELPELTGALGPIEVVRERVFGECARLADRQQSYHGNRLRLEGAAGAVNAVVSEVAHALVACCPVEQVLGLDCFQDIALLQHPDVLKSRGEFRLHASALRGRTISMAERPGGAVGAQRYLATQVSRQIAEAIVATGWAKNVDSGSVVWLGTICRPTPRPRDMATGFSVLEESGATVNTMMRFRVMLGVAKTMTQEVRDVA